MAAEQRDLLARVKTLPQAFALAEEMRAKAQAEYEDEQELKRLGIEKPTEVDEDAPLKPTRGRKIGDWIR